MGKYSKCNTSLYLLGAAMPLLVFPFQAAAEGLDFTPDSTRYLTDPAYLPMQGQIYGATAYQFGQLGGTTGNTIGGQRSDFTDNDNTFSQSLAYGVTDDLDVHISGSYALDHNKTYYTSGASAGVTDDGFSDPTFGITWRGLDEKEYPVNLDFTANYSPNWIPAKSGTVSTSGTIARGGQVASFGPAVSYETKSFTIAGSFLANYYGSRSSLNQGNDVDTNVDHSWAYTASIATQTRFDDQWSLNMSVAETFNQGYNASYTNPSNELVSYGASARNITALTAGVNYQFIPNTLAGTVFYQLNLYENQDINYAPPFATSGGDTHNESDNIVGARLSYAFR